jgi:hypothetical protein
MIIAPRPDPIGGQQPNRNWMLLLAAAQAGYLYEQSCNGGAHCDWTHRRIFNKSGVGPVAPRRDIHQMFQAGWVYPGAWGGDRYSRIRLILPTPLGLRILIESEPVL